jgi:hypothetical protein
MYEWLPYFKEFTLAWDLKGQARFDHDVDAYSYHAGFAPMLFATLDIRRDDYDFALAQKLIELWRRAADLLLYGDYYALTRFHHSPSEWVARQFDSPETGRGLVQGLRLPAAPAETLTVELHGLLPGAIYEFEEAETGETRSLLAAADGRKAFTLAAPLRGATLWFYRRRER